MLDLAVSVLLLGIVPFILLHPVIGVYAWYVVAYLVPHRLTYSFAYTFPFAMVFALATLSSWMLSREPKRPRVISAPLILMLLFAAYFTVTTYFALVPVAAWDEWERNIKIIVMSYVAACLLTTRERIHGMIWIVVIGLGFYSFKGGVFTVLTGGVHQALGPPGSFMFDRNFFAGHLVIVLPLIRYISMQSSYRIVRLGAFVLMAMTPFAILGTSSRAGFLSLGIVALALIWKSRQRFRILLLVSVLAAAAVNFVPEQWIERMNTIEEYGTDASFQSRVRSWAAAIEVATERPLVGAGLEGYRSPRVDTNFAWHSAYFQVLGEQGIVGFAIYAALWLTAWLQLSKIRRLARGNPALDWAADLASMCQVSIVAFAIGGATVDMAYVDMNFHLIAIIVALYGVVTQELAAPRTHRSAVASGDEPALQGVQNQRLEPLHRGRP